ncbi:hypothetical protein K438DRAFT_2030097 [Mycena galopus ATCC 62051]|nr:hypothetical protein K438DRAFT_2030097 [Mycena galopus ATCC 62051]
MSFRHRTPPPLYERPPGYEEDVSSSSSPSVPQLHLASSSSSPIQAVSELASETETFRDPHTHLPLSFDPDEDPFPASLLIPPRSLGNTDIAPGPGLFHVSVFPAAPRRTKYTPVVPHPPGLTPVIPDAKDFEIYVEVMAPAPTKPVGRVGRSKNRGKVEPEKFGPIPGNTDMIWEDALEAIADLLGTSTPYLVLSSMEWRWVKPKNSARLPLRDFRGYNALIRQLLNPPKGVSATQVIVATSQPMKVPSQASMSWSARPALSTGPGSFEAIFNAVHTMGPNEDMLSDEESKGKKFSLDENIEEQIEQISQAYPPGTCTEHPNIECFHSRVNGLHFELTRPRKIVWASAICKGTCKITGPPLASNFFKSGSAIKTKTAPAPAPAASSEAQPQTASAPPSAPPLGPSGTLAFPLPMTPYHGPYPYPAPYLLPMAYPGMLPSPGFGPYHAQMPSWFGTPRARRQRSWDGSSPPRTSSSKRRREDPPSSPTVSSGTLDDFLDKYPGLPDVTGAFLRRLDFEIGDDLSVVPEAEWRAEGLTVITWNRIVSKYEKYKRSLR